MPMKMILPTAQSLSQLAGKRHPGSGPERTRGNMNSNSNLEKFETEDVHFLQPKTPLHSIPRGSHIQLLILGEHIRRRGLKKRQKQERRVLRQHERSPLFHPDEEAIQQTLTWIGARGGCCEPVEVWDA